jgi:hypothetical protein
MIDFLINNYHGEINAGKLDNYVNSDAYRNFQYIQFQIPQFIKSPHIPQVQHIPQNLNIPQRPHSPHIPQIQNPEIIEFH